ncbi:MAG TPA: hypothetical protein VM146_20125, partial [Steroidobacteraceae bacterium]|nr:hypothetical protein [Steroidobacteraceae bacterium]
RMRLVTLAEIPEQWAERVRSWHRVLGEEARALDDSALEYFFYQTLLGSFPASGGTPSPDYRERLGGAMIKAAREARRRTSWARPNEEYEARLTALIDAALGSPRFMDEFRPFQQRVAHAGARNSLVQTVLKLTLPGVPDIYQGSELWDLTLVDPDNRRAVDYDLRSRMLGEMLSAWERDPAASIRDLAGQWQDGRIKMLLIAVLLRLRSTTDAFETGDYLPCEVTGGEGGAFLRRGANAQVLVTFRRFPFAGANPQPSSRLRLPESRQWHDVLRRRDGAPDHEWAVDAELPVGVYLSN